MVNMLDDDRFKKKVETNSTDLDLAIRKGCNPMMNLFDPSHDNLPYFGNVMSGPDPKNTHHESFSLSHIPGRWLNALVSVEDLGISMDCEKVIETLAEWTYRSFDHAMGLSRSLDLNTFEIIPVSELHNLRETTHALAAMIRHCGDKRAAEIAKKQIDTVDRYFDHDTGHWDEERFRRERGGSTSSGFAQGGKPPAFPTTFGRYIGSLVRLYLASHMESALVQAIKLKDYAFKSILDEGGNYDAELFGSHTHSTTAMISSLALLAQVIGDHEILERVRAFVENGLNQIALEFGWCIENYYRRDHYGEINNTADIMEACLILGKAGWTEYFQRAERILRGHFLPAQLLDTSFIPEWECPDQDYRHRLASRARGAFGFPCPYGHEYKFDGWISFNWDIVGGGVAGLCQAYKDKVTKTESLVSVNLHFDHSDEDLSVKSPYTNEGIMEVAVKRPVVVRVRLSDWVDRRKLTVRINQQPADCHLSGAWLYLSGLKQGDRVEIGIPMTVIRQDYEFRSEVFSFRWKGDAVDAVASEGKRLCFFDAL
jgi:hypothetical protein